MGGHPKLVTLRADTVHDMEITASIIASGITEAEVELASVAETYVRNLTLLDIIAVQARALMKIDTNGYEEYIQEIQAEVDELAASLTTS